jgi:hypothetical protein
MLTAVPRALGPSSTGFPFETAPRYLIRERDGIYGEAVRCSLGSLSIEEVLTAPCPRWQSPYVERLSGSIRRACLDHVIGLVI